MLEAIKAYRLGKRTEKLYDDAKRALMIRFTALQVMEDFPDGAGAALMNFIFEEDIGGRPLTEYIAQHKSEMEASADEILQRHPDLKELVSATLFLKLNICRAHGRRDLCDQMMDSRTFNKYCDFKFLTSSEGLDRLEALITRTQANMFRP